MRLPLFLSLFSSIEIIICACLLVGFNGEFRRIRKKLDVMLLVAIASSGFFFRVPFCLLVVEEVSLVVGAL